MTTESDMTSIEIKQTQHRGFFTSLIFNGIYFFIRSVILARDPYALGVSSLFLVILPWAVNIGIPVIALIVKPQFAVGYLAFLAAAIVGGLFLGILFVGACFITIVAMIPLGVLGESGQILAVYCVLPVTFFAGLYYGGKALWPQISKWWAGERSQFAEASGGQQAFNTPVGDEPDDGDQDVQAAGEPGGHKGQGDGGYVNH